MELHVPGANAHAYIIEGPEGADRDKTVRDFVMSALCDDPDEFGRPCLTCTSCRKVMSGTHEDLFKMEQSGKTSYRVQDASAMIERLAMRPYGKRLVGVIDRAELLGDVVQNKLLKTLEEPYPGTLIVLVTSNRGSLLETVRSRCALVRMTGVDGESAAGDARELAEVFASGCRFHEFRTAMEKKVKDMDGALAFLDEIEKDAHAALIASAGGAGAGTDDAERLSYRINTIENTRKDIMRGMSWKNALKALFLELDGI